MGNRQHLGFKMSTFSSILLEQCLSHKALNSSFAYSAFPEQLKRAIPVLGLDSAMLSNSKINKT